MTFRTRRPPSDLSPQEARRALSGLLPLIEELALTAYPDADTADGDEPEARDDADPLDRVTRQTNPMVTDVLRAYPPGGNEMDGSGNNGSAN